MATLSAIMIVKNEADCLEACLKSVADIADEIVIGDTGSTDRTVSIAKEFGAVVFPITWENDFAAARNKTIEAATGDWLLHMDADEELDAEGAGAIRHIVDTDEDSDAVELILANYSNDAHSWRWTTVDPAHPMTRGYAGCLPVGLLRLFRANRGFGYRELVHENITASVREANGVVRKTEILIHHYGYACAPELAKKKARFYLELAREKCRTSPKDLKCLHDVAEQAMACGEADEAESACRNALAIEPGHLAIATVLSTILLARGGTDEAYALLAPFESSGESPSHVQVILGAIACFRGHWAEAEERLGRVIDASPVAPTASLWLARVCDYQGKPQLARDVLEKLVLAAPHLKEARERLASHERRQAGESAYLAGSVESALKLLVEALKLDSEDGLTHNDLGVVLHDLGDAVRARASFERALKLAPAAADVKANASKL